MRRIAAWSAALICFSTLACSTAGVTPEPLALPEGCVAVTDPTVTLSVDDEAQVDRPCIGIRMGMTDVVWTGTANVKRLLIAFKTNASPLPEDPPCPTKTCKLTKAKHATKPGDFYYSVVVLRQNGSPKTADPRLIIQP